MYYIINKVECLSGIINRTHVGYVTSQSEAETINSGEASAFQSWVDDNYNELVSGEVNVSEYFDNSPYHYVASQRTTSVDGMGLNEITDLSSLGVE